MSLYNKIIERKEKIALVGLGVLTYNILNDENKLSGNYSTLLAKKYELKEKIGAYIGINSENFKLIFNTFYNDNTF